MPAKKTEEVTTKVTKTKAAPAASKAKTAPKAKAEAKPAAKPKAAPKAKVQPAPAAPVQPQIAPAPQPQVVQPQAQPQQASNVLFDANGNPVFVQPVAQPRPIFQQETEEEKKRKARKIGPFVASLVTLVLSFVFLGLAVLFFGQFMSGASSDLGTFFLFLVYMLTGIGFITFVPGLGLAIAAVTCSCIAVKSNIKALKIISIFTIIFSVISLIAAVALPFFLPTLFSAVTSGGSGTGMGA